MINFTATSPDLETYWRSIILFGRNVASYKFALAKSLIELRAQERELIRLDDLAVPFAKNVCIHLKESPKQGTFKSSKFLTACRNFNNGELSETDLIEQTVKLGFVNVLDAFHVVNQAEIPKRFFLDERRENAGIRLTEDFFSVLEGRIVSTQNEEVESRWRLVETAWSLGVTRNLVAIEHDPKLSIFFSSRGGRRRSVTSSRSALNGYQKGRCFYCFGDISVLAGDQNLAEVDHFFPQALQREVVGVNLDGVWNLVLCCVNCNRGKGGKHYRLPSTEVLLRLYTRNEFLIGSHHPLRETLISQTGASEIVRRSFLQRMYNEAMNRLIHIWKPILVAAPVF